MAERTSGDDNVKTETNGYRAHGGTGSRPTRWPILRSSARPRFGWAFAVPAVIGMIVLVFIPLGAAVAQSLTAPGPGFAGRDVFVGLANYVTIVSDAGFKDLVLNSVIWTVGVVAGQNVLGFAVALLMNSKWTASGFLRAAIVVPWVLPGVVSAVLWRFMYDPQLGLVSSVVERLSGSIVQPLAETNTALTAVIIAAVWKGFPFSFLLYLAALQTIDESQIEAARMDGARLHQIIWNVILPAMLPVIGLTILLTSIFTFNYFDLIWVATKGGPIGSTEIFPTEIFQTGFGEFKFARAAALGVIAFLVLLVVLVPYLRHVRKEESEATR